MSPIRTVLLAEERRHWPLGNWIGGREAILDTVGAGSKAGNLEVESETPCKSTFQAIAEFGGAAEVKLKLELETVYTSGVTSAIPDRPRASGKE
jgi:hypothetical protein